MEFWSSALANFFGSLSADVLVVAAAYLFITRKLEIVRPLRERQQEQRMVCDLIARELEQFRYSVGLFKDGHFEARIQTHAWEALKGSQAIRFLPIRCLEPVLNSYSGIYTVNEWLARSDLAETLSWTAPGSGAAILMKKLREDVIKLAEETDKDCKQAVEALRSQAKRLPHPSAPENWVVHPARTGAEGPSPKNS